MELFKASHQWSTRPDDERFTTLQDLYDATHAYAQSAGEKVVPWDSLRVEAVADDVELIGRASVPARLTHWAFGQLASEVGAPPSYLRRLPATLACQNLNHGLKQRPDTGNQAQLLFHANGSLLLRAVTTEVYERVWNYEVVQRLLTLQENGWEPATPDIRDGGQDEKHRHALYASDHDLFAFLRLKNRYLELPGNSTPLYRGLIAENSEVGDRTLKATRFYYNEMCGNHIIWGASQVIELSLRHVGTIRDRIGAWTAELRRYADASSSEEEGQLLRARQTRIAGTKDEVLDKLFSVRKLGIPRKTLEAGYEAVKPIQDGDPRTVWGMLQGLTRHSQTLPYADARNQLDRSAGKLLTINF